jgi:hypothetical protein
LSIDLFEPLISDARHTLFVTFNNNKPYSGNACLELRWAGGPGLGLGGQQPRGCKIGLPPGAAGLRAGEIPLAGVEHGRAGSE